MSHAGRAKRNTGRSRVAAVWSAVLAITVFAAMTFAAMTFANTAVANASDPPADVVARFHVGGATDLAHGFGAVWVVTELESDTSSLIEINPKTNRVIRTVRLDSSAGDFAIGDGSIWVSMYYNNTLERLDRHGRLLATIRVGFQPQFIDIAFGSVWTSNHHGRSVSRINPRTNRVMATIAAGDQHTFRNGPQGLTHDGDTEYITASDGSKPFERIDPATDRTTDYAGPYACGDVQAVAGSIWMLGCATPESSSALYQVAPADGSTQMTIAVNYSFSFAVLRRSLWVGDDTAFDPNTGAGTDAVLQQVNARTGTLGMRLSVGGDASEVRRAAGDLWVLDWTAGVIERVHVS